VARGIEILLALTALVVALITAYTAYVSISHISEAPGGMALAPVGFLLAVLEGTVIVLGLRLAFVRLRPEGRIVRPPAVAGYAVVCAMLFGLAWWRDDRFPPQAWSFLGGAVVGLAAFLVGRRRD
jgi:peptidoglycan/LPS O-acetylase OafA/YrhL